MKPETKYKGSIKLSAIGDALGWITEFEKSSNSIREKYGTDLISKFYPWKKNVGGRFYGYTDNIKPGSYSDDTQLLLAVARCIDKNGEVNHNHFAKVELANWLDYARGGGRTVKAAAEKIQRKTVNWNSNFYNYKSNGETIDYKQSGANGAAMRVLPIALANVGNIDKIKEEIFCNSIITHGHPRAIIGAMLYGYAINQIIIYRPDDFNWENYIKQIGQDLPEKFDLSNFKRVEIKEWINLWNSSSEITFQEVYKATIIETQNLLRYIYQSLKHNSNSIDTLNKIGSFDPSSKGSGIVTVIAGIYLTNKYHNEPLAGIIEAVNALGSDTDSIAAFTGGLLGALHGQNIIPDKWKSVQDIDYLDNISETLLAISEDRFAPTEFQLNNQYHLLNCPKVDNFKQDQEIKFVPLGKGIINSIDRQPTLTKGKYTLLVEANLEIGQTIIVSKIFDDLTYQESVSKENPDQLVELIELAKTKLTEKTYKYFESYLTKNNKSFKSHIDFLINLLKNE